MGQVLKKSKMSLTFEVLFYEEVSMHLNAVE